MTALASSTGFAILPLLARLGRPALAGADPERAHRAALALLGLGLALGGGSRAPANDRRLRVRVLGLDFPSPIGLAAGFDKDGKAAPAWAALGFGFAEIGTVTPRPQNGNERPRLFRLPADGAVINRMGFNNDGVDHCVARLRRFRAAGRIHGPLGLNVGINKDGSDPLRDYPALVAAASTVADYVVLNVSSPNTPGLRDLQAEDRLGAILDAAVPRANGVPVLVKLAPDLADDALDPLVRLAGERGVGGLVVANTTIARPPGLAGRHATERGGLSGRPLVPRARQLLRRAAAARDRLGAPLALVSCGGIETGDEVLRRLHAGADLVQIYTGFAYGGAALPPRLARELRTAMDRAGIDALSDRR